MLKLIKLLFFCLIILNSSILFSQIKVKELQTSNTRSYDPVFFNSIDSDNLFHLNSDWKIYHPDDPSSKIAVTIPAVFSGEEEMVFEREIILNRQQIDLFIAKVIFLGVNYSAEILLNDIIIHRQEFGAIPFKVVLPKELLRSDSPNILSVKIYHHLDSEDTVPVKQRFLFPESIGGITRDVFLNLIPKTNISDCEVANSIDQDLTKADISFNTQIELEENWFRLEEYQNADFNLVYSILFQNTEVSRSESTISLDNKENIPYSNELTLSINNPVLWTPLIPQSYVVKIELRRNSQIIDEFYKQFALYSLKLSSNQLLLNEREFSLSGTTFYLSDFATEAIPSIESLAHDLRTLKAIGFNAVRFSKSLPHPYLLKLSQDLGLFAFLEVPINSIPESFTEDENFSTRIKSYVSDLLNAYSTTSCLIAVGMGGSYLPSSPAHSNFISELGSIIKNNSNYFSYSSFVSFPTEKIENLDLYGIELFSSDMAKLEDSFNSTFNIIDKNRIFISEATYPVSAGKSSGYLTPNSYEAQAKFYEDLINLSNRIGFSGYFVNTIYDYRGDFHSLYSGYDESKVYKIGIVGEDKQDKRLAYNVIHAKLNDEEKVTIPIGSYKDDSQIFFILVGLVLSVIMALLINSKRKFREDATRALLRPYNFFADIRDQRILSSVHSHSLMVILAAVHALLLTILLYFLKSNILVEKILIASGIEGFLEIFSYLSWNPIQSFIYLFLLSLLIIFSIVALVKLGSLFIKTKVLLSSIYIVVIWSFLPMILLIPAELVLYKVLIADIINPYIFGFLVFYLLWILQRIIKGIYVIFDSPAIKVYFYAFLFLFFVGIISTLYFQLSHSSIDFIVNSIKQYNLIGA